MIVALGVVWSAGCWAAGCKVLDPDLAQGYEGGCRDGFAEGQGRAWGSAVYDGGFRRGLKHGRGTKAWPNGDAYQGEFRADRREGRGRYVWGTRTPWAGDSFEGGYRADMRHGHGVYEWASGDRYEGEWTDDVRQGPSLLEQRQADAREAAVASLRKHQGETLCRYMTVGITGRAAIRARLDGVAEDRSLQLTIENTDPALSEVPGAEPGKVLVDDPLNWGWCL
ncbi:MAG: hypothetical protein HY778_17715 [Betaproteobacteria bacterium]|nr:hypothetical protein [Betaproteobacteria bacterium]